MVFHTSFHSEDKVSDGDCNDNAPHAYPGAAENSSLTLCMEDEDGDGYGDSLPPSGVIAGNDCDDADAFAYHGAALLDSTIACMRDADGDGYGESAPSNSIVTAGTDCDDSDATLDMADLDGDGQSSCSGDCNDSSEYTYALLRTFIYSHTQILHGSIVHKG